MPRMRRAVQWRRRHFPVRSGLVPVGDGAFPSPAVTDGTVAPVQLAPGFDYAWIGRRPVARRCTLCVRAGGGTDHHCRGASECSDDPCGRCHAVGRHVRRCVVTSAAATRSTTEHVESVRVRFGVVVHGHQVRLGPADRVAILAHAQRCNARGARRVLQGADGAERIRTA